MHMIEPGWTVTADMKQIKCLPSARMLGQSSESTVGSAEVGNSVVQRCAIPQTQLEDAFGLHIFI